MILPVGSAPDAPQNANLPLYIFSARFTEVLFFLNPNKDVIFNLHLI